MKAQKKENKAKDITLRTILICYLAWFTPFNFKLITTWLMSKLDNKQARAAFHSAYEFMLEGKWWFASKSPLWFAIFNRWLETCNEEGLVKGLFFEVNYQFLDEKGLDTDNPLKSSAIKKWLTFVTEWSNPNHREVVWNLYWNWGTQPQWEGYKLLDSRRKEFANAMVDGAQTIQEAVDAYEFGRQHGGCNNDQNEICDRAHAKCLRLRDEQEKKRFEESSLRYTLKSK